jgi:3-oxoacyl-[acyl-carrier protein] reductase
MNLGLAGRGALVCASTSGLGLAVGRELAAEGAQVLLCGRRADLAEQLAAELPGAAGVGIDLLEPDAPRRLVDAAQAVFGAVDVLVLNSGGPPTSDAQDQDRDSLLSAVERLLLTQVELVRLCLPGMVQRGWGRIIAIGSSGVVEPIPGLAQSNVGRAALAGYLKTLAGEVAADGVTVNMVLPGRIATERSAQVDAASAQRRGHDAAQVRAEIEAAIPAHRYGDPAEFAAVTAFLASDRASYITGSQVRVDGGMTHSF